MVPFFHTLFTPFSHDFHTHSPSSDSQARKNEGSHLQVFTGLPILVYVIKVLEDCTVELPQIMVVK